MAEQPFDPHLSVLFGDAPAFDDASAFAASVEKRLSREARIRTLTLGGAGALGAALTVAGAAGLSEEAADLLAGLDRWAALLAQPASAAWLAGGALIVSYAAAVLVGEV